MEGGQLECVECITDLHLSRLQGALTYVNGLAPQASAGYWDLYVDGQLYPQLRLAHAWNLNEGSDVTHHFLVALLRGTHSAEFSDLPGADASAQRAVQVAAECDDPSR